MNINSQPDSRPEPSTSRPAGDSYDLPFERFQPYHFTAREFARLLLVRSAVLESRDAAGRYSDDLRVA
jgi:hypothetical protein